MITLSPSKINKFLTCAYAWKEHYYGEREWKDFDYLVFGSLVHKIIECDLKGINRPGINNDMQEKVKIAIKAFNKRIAKHKLDEKSIYVEQKRAINSRQKPVDFEDNKAFLRAIGDIDYYIPEEKTHYIIDIKTGWNIKPYEDYIIQFMSNAYLILCYATYKQINIPEYFTCEVLRLMDKPESFTFSAKQVFDYRDNLDQYQDWMEKAEKMSKNNAIKLCFAGAHCNNCLYAYRCPLMIDHSRLLIDLPKLTNDNIAKDYLRKLLSLQRQAKCIKDMLKDYIISNAPISIEESNGEQKTIKMAEISYRDWNNKEIKREALRMILEAKKEESLLNIWTLSENKIMKVLEGIEGLNELMEKVQTKVSKKCIIEGEQMEEENDSI